MKRALPSLPPETIEEKGSSFWRFMNLIASIALMLAAVHYIYTKEYTAALIFGSISLLAFGAFRQKVRRTLISEDGVSIEKFNGEKQFVRWEQMVSIKQGEDCDFWTVVYNESGSGKRRILHVDTGIAAKRVEDKIAEMTKYLASDQTAPPLIDKD